MFHLGVAAIPRNVLQAVVDGESDGVGIQVEEAGGDFELVFPHGEVKRFAISVLTACQRRVAGQQVSHGFEIARAARAEERPNVRPTSGGPL